MWTRKLRFGQRWSIYWSGIHSKTMQMEFPCFLCVDDSNNLRTVWYLPTTLSPKDIKFLEGHLCKFQPGQMVIPPNRCKAKSVGDTYTVRKHTHTPLHFNTIFGCHYICVIFMAMYIQYTFFSSQSSPSISSSALSRWPMATWIPAALWPWVPRRC